jgi:hypothetical protein
MVRVMGEAAPALAHGREAVNYAERMGSQISRVFAYLSLGIADAVNTAWNDALEALGTAPLPIVAEPTWSVA